MNNTDRDLIERAGSDLSFTFAGKQYEGASLGGGSKPYSSSSPSGKVRAGRLCTVKEQNTCSWKCSITLGSGSFSTPHLPTGKSLSFKVKQ